MSKKFLQMIDDELLRQQEDRKDRKRSGKFSPSSFGRCWRNQILNRLNHPQEPLGLGTLRTFMLGHMFHDKCQSYFPKHWCEVKIEDEDCLGFADVVTDSEVVDFKTVGSMAMRYLPKQGDIRALEDKKMGNILQVVWYAMKLDKPKARLVFIGKDDFFTSDFILFTKDYATKVQNEILTLNKYWDSKIIPRGYPRAYSGKECQYCGYKNECNKGKNVIKIEGWQNEGVQNETEQKGKEITEKDTSIRENDTK